MYVQPSNSLILCHSKTASYIIGNESSTLINKYSLKKNGASIPFNVITCISISCKTDDTILMKSPH